MVVAVDDIQESIVLPRAHNASGPSTPPRPSGTKAGTSTRPSGTRKVSFQAGAGAGSQVPGRRCRVAGAAFHVQDIEQAPVGSLGGDGNSLLGFGGGKRWRQAVAASGGGDSLVDFGSMDGRSDSLFVPSGSLGNLFIPGDSLMHDIGGVDGRADSLFVPGGSLGSLFIPGNSLMHDIGGVDDCVEQAIDTQSDSLFIPGDSLMHDIGGVDGRAELDTRSDSLFIPGGSLGSLGSLLMDFLADQVRWHWHGALA